MAHKNNRKAIQEATATAIDPTLAALFDSSVSDCGGLTALVTRETYG